MQGKVVLKEIKIFILLFIAIVLVSILGQIIAFGGFEIQVKKHIIKVIFGFAILFGISQINIRFWRSFAYLIYVSSLFSLLLVCLFFVFLGFFVFVFLVVFFLLIFTNTFVLLYF